jgi:hypothetical protein
MGTDAVFSYIAAFRRAAHAALSAPEKQAPAMPSGWRRVLLLHEEPAFDNHVARAVYTSADDRQVHVRRVTYDEAATCKQVENRVVFLPNQIPPIRLVVADAPAPLDRWTPISLGLKQIRISPAAPDSRTVGLDGVTYSLETGDFMGSIQIEWWCDGPPEWLELVEWARQYSDWVDDILESAPS